MTLVIRSFDRADGDALGQVFHRAVNEGAASRYSAEERAAWSPDAPKGDLWADRMDRADTVVAERGGVPVGFMSLDPGSGYLDLAFVAPEEMGQGTADAIYAVLEGRARARGLSALSTEASLFAEPFFARHGWRLLMRQAVVRRGVPLKNCRMKKLLSQAVPV